MTVAFEKNARNKTDNNKRIYFKKNNFMYIAPKWKTRTCFEMGKRQDKLQN